MDRSTIAFYCEILNSDPKIRTLARIDDIKAEGLTVVYGYWGYGPGNAKMRDIGKTARAFMRSENGAVIRHYIEQTYGAPINRDNLQTAFVLLIDETINQAHNLAAFRKWARMLFVVEDTGEDKT